VARVYVSFVSALMGVHPKRTSSEVMKELRKQRSEEKPVIQQLLNTESYWTLVGMIKDAFEEPKSNHIDTMKTFIKEEHPDSWYEKLYTSIRSSIEGLDKPKAIECPLTRDKSIILCGKPNIIEGKTVIDVKNTTKFSDTLTDDDKIRIHCYMKICKLKKGILREVCGTENKDTTVLWDTLYWKSIQKVILAFVQFV
jgi:hypothetical protein